MLGTRPAFAGDPARGARAFARCYACHSVDPAETHLPGPNLHGLFGRRAGTLPGFEFSEAMVEAGRARGLVWGPETLDRFLADPAGYVPGTVTGFPGSGIPRSARTSSSTCGARCPDRGV